ncbi:MAG: ketoacyl-ACP synthase III [Desulfobacterales bacterium]|nr:ketoacyl-ACP synthase III [Desulfobacterales bacterium]
MAIKRAGITVEDIGMVIHGTSTPDYIIPAEAALVASELGIEAPCFDLNSACCTFVIQISLLAGMDPNTIPTFILVVNPENYTHVLDYSDKRVVPLFGDGCSAAVISACTPSRRKFDTFYYDSTPSSWHKVNIPRSGHFHQEGRAVQGFAIRKATASVKMLQNEYPVDPIHLKFVGHQANLMMLSHVCKRCGISEENHWYNVVDFGNTGCAGAPSVLSQNWDTQVAGDHIALAVVGSGLTWAHTMLIVGDE